MMASTRSALRFASLLCLAAVTAAIPSTHSSSSPAQKRGCFPVPHDVGGYGYVGCYTDQGDQHTLTGSVLYHSDLTQEMCASFCDAYEYFGVEFGTQCYCGTQLSSTGTKRPETECSQRCGGASSEVCGASNRINIFKSLSLAAGVSNVPKIGQFSYRSCWTDDVNARSLTGAEYRSDDMTVESCAAFCKEFRFFGVEFSRECYCSNQLGGHSAPEEQCGQVCVGNSTEFCGGGSLLNVYARSCSSSSSTTSSSTLSSTSSTVVLDASSTASSSSSAEDTTTSASTVAASSSTGTSASDTVTTSSPEIATFSSATETSSTTTPATSTASSSSSITSSDVTSLTSTSDTSEASTSTSESSTSESSTSESSTPSATSTTSDSSIAPTVTSTADTTIPSTSFTSPDTTSAPTSTTQCALTTVYAGTPSPCFASVPTACASLNRTPALVGPAATNPASQCRAAFLMGATYAPAVASCFSNLATWQSFTATSAYACVTNAPVYCQFNTVCADSPQATSGNPAPTDAVSNGDFETGDMSGWTPAGSTDPSVMSAAVSSDISYDGGTYSLKSVFANSNGGSFAWYQDVSLEPGASYVASWWWYSTNSAASTVSRMQFTGAAAFVKDASTTGGPVGQWVQVTQSFTAGASFGRVRFSVYGNRGSAGNTFYVDDIALTRV